VNYFGTGLPPSTYYCFQRNSLHFWTTSKLKFIFSRASYMLSNTRNF
jgi:hypothetical protein